MGRLWLWSAFLFASGVAAFLYGKRARAQAILRWPQTRGRVDPDSIVFRAVGWLSGRPRGVYLAAAAFTYEVNGKMYNGCAVVPVGWTILDIEKERVRGDLTEFATVLYNPENPGEAYLDIPDRFQRGSVGWITVGLISASVLSLFLGGALLVGMR